MSVCGCRFIFFIDDACFFVVFFLQVDSAGGWTDNRLDGGGAVVVVVVAVVVASLGISFLPRLVVFVFGSVIRQSGDADPFLLRCRKTVALPLL